VSRLEPRPTDASLPYWEATREKRLLLQWCLGCDLPVHFPRVACPRCLGSHFEHREASGRATVHAVVVEHRPPSPFPSSAGRDDQPYAVALVDLAEGPRMVTNIVGCAPMDVQPGMAVRVTWEPLSDGRHLPLFEPLPSSDG
jgi:hypothetical protein